MITKRKPCSTTALLHTTANHCTCSGSRLAVCSLPETTALLHPLFIGCSGCSGSEVTSHTALQPSLNASKYGQGGPAC